MGIALERELEDDEEDEILKVEEAPDEAETRKRKAESLFDDLLDTDDLEIKAEIDELVHEEEEKRWCWSGGTAKGHYWERGQTVQVSTNCSGL